MSTNAGKTIKLVALDFDRTLVDLGVNWLRVRERVAACGAPEATDATRSLFDSMAVHPEIATDIFNIIKEEEMLALETAKVMPGAKEFLTWLAEHHIPFAIVSNNHHAVLERSIEKHGFAKPVMVVGSDDVTRRKPDPEGLEKILSAMGIPKSACVMIGDSRVDADLGRRAGITTFIIGTWEGNLQNFEQVKSHIL